MTALFFPGAYEPQKRAIHQVALGLCAVIGAYNLIALVLRREPHLAANVALCLAVGAVEAQNVKAHQ